MLIENNTLKRIYKEDVIDGVFTAPDDVLYIGDYLDCNNVVKMILPNVKEIGHNFLYFNNTLLHIEMPKVKKIGNGFLYSNRILSNLEIPEVEIIEDWFLHNNELLQSLIIPKVESIGNYFLYHNYSLFSLDIPNIKEIKLCFLRYNHKFNYTRDILKALKGNLYIGGGISDKTEYIRKFNIIKLLC